MAIASAATAAYILFIDLSDFPVIGTRVRLAPRSTEPQRKSQRRKDVIPSPHATVVNKRQRAQRVQNPRSAGALRGT